YSILGGGFPVTLNPTQTVTLQIQFKPTVAGAAAGQVTVSSNSSTGSTASVTLSGTGTTVPHGVNLNWNAPSSSPDPVAGYNVYRSTGGGSFLLINSVLNVLTTYVDSTVV